MSEAEYIAALKARWPVMSMDNEADLPTIALADEAVRAFPQSPKLWCMRGNLIELGPESCPHSLEQVLASYRQAITIDPGFAEAVEDAAHFCDAVLDDQRLATAYFQQLEKIREATPPSPSAR